MNRKMAVKILADAGMTAALLLLMGFEMVGEAAHEWIGVAMFLLLILHHVLNIQWTKNITRGKYTRYRAVQTLLAGLILLAMAGSMVSGIILSRHVFAFLPIKGGQALARTLHMICAYWGFVLMALHLGFHWNMFLGMARRSFGRPAAAGKWTLRILGFVGAGYGVCAFVRRDIGTYMFLKSHFVFFDYGEAYVYFLLDYIAIGVLFVFIGYYVSEWLRRK